jgi:5-formyltetrahydrofolate cyclo-ligase
MKAQSQKSPAQVAAGTRLNLPDRLQQADLLQQVMRIWLVGRPGHRHWCLLAHQR